MVNLKLKEHAGELVNESEISLYDGETASIAISTDFTYSYFYAYLNNINLGRFRTDRFGIHSSKFIDGANKLVIDFFDEENRPITNLKGMIIKRENMRGTENFEKTINNIIKDVSEIKDFVREMKAFIKEINNERSGY